MPLTDNRWNAPEILALVSAPSSVMIFASPESKCLSEPSRELVLVRNASPGGLSRRAVPSLHDVLETAYGSPAISAPEHAHNFANTAGDYRSFEGGVFRGAWEGEGGDHDWTKLWETIATVDRGIRL